MDFLLPEIGEGVYEAELVRWLVQPGSKVRRGQALVEVMTDKSTMEVNSPFSGTITQTHVELGQKVKVGQLLLSYTPSQAEAVAAPAEPAPATPAAEPATPATASARPGGTRRAPEEPVVAAPSPSTRRNGRHAEAMGRTAGAAVASPSVRHLARKLGIDLSQVQGSGPAGRILLEDVTNYLQANTTVKPAPSKSAPLPLSDFGKPGSRIPMIGLRRRIADHMTLSRRVIPDYTYVDECDITELVKLRTDLKEHFAKREVKLTYLAFFVKAVVHALKAVPIVNATLDEQAGEIVLHDYYHIGLAVATPGGLIVPVIRDADKKDLATIAEDIERLSRDARAGRSKLEDVRGSTFTITSIGGLGGLISTPIINYPEVGILGLGKVVKRPVYDEHGNLRPADVIYLSFSFDHRVVDGAVGVAFGNALMKILQTPAVMLLPERLS
jgi:2-oxoisovalerate dehydrogenase E2 component (dihydrolipoyl transacylase)